MRRLAIAGCVLVLSACGVSSQEEPQPIEESTQPTSTQTPSFETRTSQPSTSATSPSIDEP